MREDWDSRMGRTVYLNDKRKCSCGSGEQREAIHDGYGIFLTFVCSQCRERRISKFREDIFERYPTVDQIEPDE